MQVSGSNNRPYAHSAPPLQVNTGNETSVAQIQRRSLSSSEGVTVPAVRGRASPIRDIFTKMNSLIGSLHTEIVNKLDSKEKNQLSNINHIQTLAKAQGLKVEKISWKQIKKDDVILEEVDFGSTIKKNYEIFKAEETKSDSPQYVNARPNSEIRVVKGDSTPILRNLSGVKKESHIHENGKYWVVREATEKTPKVSFFERIAGLVRNFFSRK